MYDVEVTVKENKRVSEVLWILSFRSPAIAKKALPGQFLQLQVTQATDPFLRRPFSVYKIKRDIIEILYEPVGIGTRILAGTKPGDLLKALGPLGTGFTPQKKKKVLMVGGGVGAAPLVFMAERYPYEKMLLGFRGKHAVLPKSEAKAGERSKWVYATNDGSLGKKGFITQLLEEFLKEPDAKQKYFLYVCGPGPMLYETARLAGEYQVDGEISLEERMGCGMGACLGCVAETKRGYLASCRYGPVFRIQDLMPEGLQCH
ncbi:MAG: dihydroorotate dehydrogenase electron transfer subunit [Candidatus Omnitrophica bacterium]|nr:dihydroorotate dehydrogenase electron transfer subunit [Candidatus Omnitrophota bacterium]